MTHRIAREITATIVMAVLGMTTAQSTALGATAIPLDGKRISLRNTPAPGGQRNSAGFIDPDVTTTGIDPRVTGATLSIGRVEMGTVKTFDLPASGWGPVDGPRKSYRFRGSTGPVRRVRIVDGRSLRFSAIGSGTYDLGGTPQGAVGAILHIGDLQFCGLFGGSIDRDDGKRFVARNAPAPISCPQLGSTTTTTTTTTTSTTSTSTTTTTTPPTCATLPYMCQFDNNTNVDVDGCRCNTNGDCQGSCQCGNPCTVGSCPGDTPGNSTCITDPAQSNFGSCAGTCPPSSFNFCVGAGSNVPFCTDPFDNNQNLSADCCLCNTDGDCTGSCSNNNVPNTMGVCETAPPTCATPPYVCQFDNNSNVDVDGCRCNTNGDCQGTCQCGNPCTVGSCPGDTPGNSTCITDPAQSNFGSCAGTCPPSSFNFCVGAGSNVPFCTDPFDNNQNLSGDCCTCNTDGDCAGSCSNNNVPNTIGTCKSN
jgi:hypothetical protein